MLKKITIFFLIIVAFQSINAQNFDIDLLKKINPRYTTNQLYKITSSTAEPLAMSVPLGMVAVALVTENKKLELKSYEVAVSLALTVVTTGGLKVIIKRPRPYETYPNLIHPDEYDYGNSFPSAHTSMAFSTATSVFLNYKKWYVAVPLYTWAAVVGYSRMYLGQHYPTDVLAGAVVGAGSAIICHWANKKFFSK